MNDIAAHKAAIAEAKIAAETVTQGTRTELDNNLIKSDRGPTIRILLKRLARDCPELLDRIESGEISVNAAAIQADQKKGSKFEPLPKGNDNKQARKDGR